MIQLPKKNQNVFCWTSLWLLIPIYHTMETMFIITLIFSFLHWFCYKHNSFYHWADKFSSLYTLLYILYENYNFFILYPFLFYFIYYGRQYMITGDYEKHLNYHITFRYIAFWICCLYINHISIFIFTKYSVLYFLQIKLIIKISEMELSYTYFT